MKMIEWTDATSYSRDKPRVQTAWQWEKGAIRIWIGRGHRYNPERWTMHCSDLGIDTKDIGPANMPLRDAQLTAFSAVQAAIAKKVAAYNRIAEAIERAAQ
jgi:hypothetical protein